jgi:hypothetical protein
MPDAQTWQTLLLTWLQERRITPAQAREMERLVQDMIVARENAGVAFGRTLPKAAPLISLP